MNINSNRKLRQDIINVIWSDSPELSMGEIYTLADKIMVLVKESYDENKKYEPKITKNTQKNG